MSNSASMGQTILEQLGNGLSAVGNSVGRVVGRLFGSYSDRYIRGLGYLRKYNEVQHKVKPGSLLDQINVLESAMKALSDEDLKGLTPKFRERLAKGATLEDLLPEAFAACREAARRTKNMRHYDVQMLGGVRPAPGQHRGNGDRRR